MYQLKTTPWEHQLKALDYLAVRHYGALYTDMGTGKTKVGIDLIANRGFRLTVIVGTKKSCQVWEDEFNTHAPVPIVLHRFDTLSTTKKTERLKELDQKSNAQQVIIVNYDSIWRKPFSERLVKTKIDCVICDESHRIKAPGSKCSLYLTRLGKRVENRFLFTGTPSTESPIDVYAQYRFLQPSIFGTRFSEFRDHYENVDTTRTAFAGYRVLSKKEPYKNLDELKTKMYSCAFYVRADIKLPSTTDLTVTFRPSKNASEAYKELEKEGVLTSKDESEVLETNNALVKALRLQEILSGYLSLEDLDFTERKKKRLDSKRCIALKELLEDIPKVEKVVIFAKFRWDFTEIQAICKELHRKYGEISGQQDDYKAWQKDKIEVLAVHYRSGSESINLTKARYCIYYSLTHSYGLYRQSRKRVHRPGQEQPVTYYHIVGKLQNKMSIDDKIMRALANKQDLVEYLLSTTGEL